MFIMYYEAPFCYLSLHSDGKFLTKIDFLYDIKEEIKCDLLIETKNQLKMYFCKKLTKFNLPIKLNGTPFEQKVYKQLLKIPYGKTSTYKEIAYKIGHKNAFRAVGNANSKNQIPIIIPCHRVLAKNHLGGYNGGIDIKKYLLSLEQN